MAKSGVSAVSGITSPVIGEKYVYNIVSWYPATTAAERDAAMVTWELFKKRSNGKFTTTNIKKKGRSDFTFGQAATGHTYRLEAYRYKPEGGGLIITPKPAKIPKINKVELFYVDDTKGNVFSFMEKLRAKANCANMLGKELLFTLWEDDAKGAGHSTSNQAIDAKKAKVNKNGIAVAEFSLTTALMLKAARGEMDSQLEFYVTVEYFTNKKHASGNVNVKNPYYSAAPKTNTSAPKPAPAPKAKGSPAESKPPSRKEEAGIIENIYQKAKELWDRAEIKGTATKQELPTVQKPDGKTATIKRGENLEESKQEKCPNCTKEITIDEINEVLGDKEDQDYRKKIVLLLNEFISLRKGTKQELHINTCLRKAHYLSEIATETSLLEKKLTEGNTPPYYSENNIKNIWPARYKELVNSGKLSQVAAERPQKQLLNYVYGQKNGNKGGDDGWNYRGKGLIQLTGKTNYKDASVFLKNVFPNEYVNLEEQYDKVAEIRYAVLSSIAFWEGKSVYKVADISKTKETVSNVRFLINSYDKGNTHTQKYFENALEAFKVPECKKDKVEIKKSNSKVVLDFVGKTAKASALSDKTKNILREVGEASGNYYIAITSTARTPYDQARIMYDNCKSNLKEQRNTYKAPGQRVIDVYEDNKSKPRDSVIKLMEEKINELGPSNVSKHLANPEILNTFDIAYGSLKNKENFLSEIKKRVELDIILIENNCYHTQIKQK